MAESERNSKQPPMGLPELADAALADARLLAGVLSMRASHPHIRSELGRHLPDHLTKPQQEWQEAQSTASQAEHYHEQALRGVWYNEWNETREKDQETALKELQEDRAKAEKEVARTRAKMEEVFPARTEAENTFVEKWIGDRAPGFRERFSEYGVAFATHRVALDGLNDEPLSVGKLSENSACGLLRLITDRLVSILDAHAKGDYLSEDWHQQDLPDDDEWEPLALAVRREAARVAAKGSTSDASVTKPPGERRSAEGPTQTVASNADPDLNPESPPPSDAVNALIRDGKVWRITFGGVERILPDLKGLQYLQKLVANPDKEISVANLQGGSAVLLTSKHPIADSDARTAMKRDLEDASFDLEQAEKNNDPGLAETARERMEVLRRSIEEVSSPVGRKEMPKELNRVRAAAGKAIGKALDEIRRVHPEAHAHLTRYLTSPTGFSPSYRPPTKATWLVNPTATTEG